MQSLGDSTLAELMKSDLASDFEARCATKSSTRSKSKVSSTIEDASDIGKYFVESVMFSAKDSRKVNQDGGSDDSPNQREVSKVSKNGVDAVASERCSVGTLHLAEENAPSTLSEPKSFRRSTIDSILETSSAICTLDRCKLSSWGLPPMILRKYESRGVRSMFPWQVECLSNRNLLETNRNLVYSAPTSAGKTLVAEILMIKTVMERRKKVIFILPFVSVVREKMYYFQDLLSESGLRVEGFMGGSAPVGGFAATDVAIATIEKANSLLNQLMEEGNLVSLGAVVIDELHLLGDPYRGYLLELLLTKLKYMTLKEELVHVQLIGMSATLPNLSLLANWLDAELYRTDFRPVPLNEYCKIGTSIYDSGMNVVRTLPTISQLSSDSDNILQLCLETISDGHSVLIFCPTKNWCEKLAHQVALTFRKLGREDTQIGRTLREQLSMEAIVETLEQLKRSPAGLDSVLKSTVSFGTAFHHAGLTMDERDVIEGSFRSGALRVLTATSTLSSGVNLPARRVIIRSLMFHGKPLDTLTYRQMIGRAGRMGKDTAGESIIVCKPNERKSAATLLSAELQPIESCLEGSEPLIRALLEAVASEVAYTARDIDLYTKCTLISFANADLIEESTGQAMRHLVDNELLMVQTTKIGDERWIATQLGKACLAASIPPTDGLFLFDELQKARRCFVLDTELHVIYLVTPLNSSSQIGSIDWIVFLDLWKTISESERRVGQLVGVEESFVMNAIRGSVRPGRTLNVHKRFYTALALHELVREVPLVEVCRKYGCCRGVVQGLQQSAATFAGMITQFCKKLGWSCMELLIGQFQARLQFGVCRDLLDLLRLPLLNGLRARSLHKEGITSVAELAVADELDVERALHKALPFESGKEHDGECEYDAAKRNKMRSVFVTGRDGLTPREAAIILVREARTLVQNELGVDDLRWKQRERLTTSIDGSRSSGPVSNGSVDQTSSSIKPPEVVNDTAATARQATGEEIETTAGEDNSDRNEEKLDELDDDAVELEVDPRISEKVGNVSTVSSRVALENSETASKIGEGSCNEDIFEFTSSAREDDSHRNDEKLDELDDDVFEPEVDARISEEVANVSTVSTRVPLETNSKIGEVSCNEDIFEFTSSAASVDLAGQIGSKTREAICEEINLGLTDPPITLKREAEKTTSIGSPAIMLRRSNAMESESRSPSLFGDSLNINSQECNMLERNVVDSLDISTFGDTILSEFAKSRRNTPESASSGRTKKILRSSTGSQRRSSLKNIGSRRSSLISEGKSRSNSLGWADDSWNNTDGVIEKVCRTDVPSNCRIGDKNDTKNSDIRNITNVIIEKENRMDVASNFRIRDTKDMKNSNIQVTNKCVERDQKVFSAATSMPKSNYERMLNIEELKIIPQKRKLSESSLEQSPIASVLKFADRKRLSIDSNKSDSDDAVFPSQGAGPSMSAKKNRTKIKLESLRRSRVERDTITRSLGMNELEDGHSSTGVLCDNRNFENIEHDIEEEATSRRRNAFSSTKTLSTVSKASQPRNKITVSSKTVNRTRSKKTSSFSLNEPQIVKVTGSLENFNSFKRELADKKDIALALSCETFSRDTVSIGTKIIGVTGADGRKRTKKIENCIYGNKKLCGVAISWDGNVVHYISFDNTQGSKVPVKERLEIMTEILSDQDITVRCFSFKETYKMLYNCCGIASSCKFLDPKTIDWLLDPDHPERSFNALITEHLNEAQFILQRTGTLLGGAGPGLNVKSAVDSEIRATIEAALTWHLANTLMNRLEEISPTLLQTFKEIEMGTLTLLARMELTGLGVSLNSLQELSHVIQKEMSQLEERAYSLAGRQFNISSSKSVAQVLGLYKGKKVSTSKAVLQNCGNPISDLVVSWRKLSTTQIKVVFPLLSLAQCNSRVYGNCVTNTSTGRVSMHEPNLQNVPRDFSSQDGSFVISVRMAFVPIVGNVMMSADYCQLELRILAHFSKEPSLCRIFKKEGDVFKNIAARWYNIAEETVDDGMRHRTKQLCYGMIYGMGVKTLAETLSVTEAEAKEFLETFMEAYPGIRRWLAKVVDGARADGYVTTLMQRRRFFPALHSPVPGERSQAERQAVNTKVQGSAADIAKKAMVIIDERMRREYPGEPLVLADAPIKRKLRNYSRDFLPRGGYLVLQIHDELLYEVHAGDVQQVAKIIQESMEQSCQLRVPLPVKLKIGPTWGDMTEYKL